MDVVRIQEYVYVTCIVTFIIGLEGVTSSRDLALHKHATQSTTFDTYDAGRAVDGTPGRDVSDGHCTYTGNGQSQAWWKVDLGQVYGIQMINITYRHNYTFRLSGYYLYVTNHTDMTHGDGSINVTLGYLCYHDNGPRYPSYIQSHNCTVSGRYVVFYNKRPAESVPTHHDSSYSNSEASIELCEVQVFHGCPVGQFGDDCGFTCHCAEGDCDSDTGICDVRRCQTGWRGPSCYVPSECTNQTFGQDCNKTCHCASPGCDRRNGICTKPGCKEGWFGDTCSTECTNNTFGQNCNKTCHCVNSGCDRRSGICTKPGCTEGWSGDTCTNECTNNTFGQNCNKTCHCVNSGCDRRSGICTKPGCTEGWSGDTCTNECVGNTFGRNCNDTCHCASRGCDRRSGICAIPGCTEGWTGDKCSQGCTSHTYGRDCNQTCHCASSDCDRRNGICNIPGCTDGWTGDTCSQKCTHQKFGRDCNRTCHCANSGCDKRSGICTIPGCTEGWMGISCSQEQEPISIKGNRSHFEEVSNCQQCTTGYAVFGTFLSISISFNIGLIVHCLRMRFRDSRTQTTSNELQTYQMPDHEDNYEGLDSSKMYTIHNVYETIVK